MNKVMAIHKTSGVVVFGYGQGVPEYYSVYSLAYKERRNYQSLLIGTDVIKDYTITPIPAFPGETMQDDKGRQCRIIGYPCTDGRRAIAVEVQKDEGSWRIEYIMPETLHPIPTTYPVTVQLTKEEMKEYASCYYASFGTSLIGDTGRKVQTVCAVKLAELKKENDNE
jgi:hypothetical protein